jgi:co-chaperonin GroES (HSP10)
MKTLTDVIAVIRDEPDEKSPGGIIIPEQVRKYEEMGYYFATVHCCGPQCIQLKPGDRIIFNRSQYAPMEIEGQKYCMMHEHQVLAKVEN